jgi:hypothetical protein
MQYVFQGKAYDRAVKASILEEPVRRSGSRSCVNCWPAKAPSLRKMRCHT